MSAREMRVPFISMTIIFILVLSDTRVYSESEGIAGTTVLLDDADAAQKTDYQSLSLEDCPALALKYNPVLSGAKEKIRELVADYQAARLISSPGSSWYLTMKGQTRIDCPREADLRISRCSKRKR